MPKVVWGRAICNREANISVIQLMTFSELKLLLFQTSSDVLGIIINLGLSS